MIVMDVCDVIRDILGSSRVQFLHLSLPCANPEASRIDFQFRGQLFDCFDYAAYVDSLMALVPEEGVLDYKDDFGLHYLIFPELNADSTFFLGGPYLYHACTEEQFQRLIRQRGLSEDSIEAIRWYFKRVPVISDVLAWRRLFSMLLCRYFSNPDITVQPVECDHVEMLREKPASSLSSIPYTSIEARYEAEAKMLDAIRRGDFSEAAYQQNLFMSFSIDSRHPDPLRNAKDMVIAASAIMRKAVQQAEVHPLYIDSLSGQLLTEIEAAENEAQVSALVPRMVRHYCLLVQTYSRERYSSVVRDVLNFVDFHYMEPLSLDSLAQRYAVNKNYLSTRFSKEVGMTLTDYINLTRVRRSLKLLKEASASMQEIAERVGFTNANYYTRIFKKIHGTTPNEYRQTIKAEKKKFPS